MTRRNVIACGRRWGKTIMGTNRLIEPALEGWPTAWFAPNYKDMHEVWDDVESIVKPILRKSNKSEGRMTLTTGGVIEFWSLKDNPDAGRSRKYKRVIIDEAAKAKALAKVWQEAIRPTLTDYAGDADFYSTPKGLDFFAAQYQKGLDGARGYRSWTMPSSTNPYLPPEEIEEARLELPERVFQQEYLAEFIEDAGGVFRGVRAVVDKGRRDNEAPEPGSTYYLGVDLARTEDFTVLSVVRDDGRHVYFERFNQISWERQLARIGDVARRYDALVVVDSTGIGDPLAERLRRDNLRLYAYTLTNASKEALIDGLAIKIEKGEVRLLDHETQTNELLAYQYELTPSRNVKMGAPEGMHDDTVIALALACWGIGKRRTLSILT
jgi:phage FluMu gp28-like protein